MKYFLSAVGIMLGLCSFAQERYFFGRVVDEQGRGVPFAVVQAKDMHQGVYCTESGTFSFKADAQLVKSFIFFSLGFTKREIKVTDLAKDSIIVQLPVDHVSLNTVTFSPPKTEAILGNKFLGHLGDSYGKYGSEHAIFLKPNKDIAGGSGTIKEIFVFITDEGIPNTKFRIHVYSRDTATKLPGKDLADSNIIVQAKHGNEWVKADVSKLKIPVKGGVFISVEWVSGNGNVMTDLQSAKNPTVTQYNGQVLGLTDDYGPKRLAYARHTLLDDNWIRFDCTERPYTEPKCVNPMIYCTYTYID